MESKLTDLEIRLTHHEVALEEMSEVMIKQQQILESLRGDVTALQRQLRDMSSPGNIASAEEESPPPHY